MVWLDRLMLYLPMFAPCERRFKNQNYSRQFVAVAQAPLRVSYRGEGGPGILPPEILKLSMVIIVVPSILMTDNV